MFFVLWCGATKQLMTKTPQMSDYLRKYRIIDKLFMMSHHKTKNSASLLYTRLVVCSSDTNDYI